MKALYALAFVSMSFHAFAASTETRENTTAAQRLNYIYNLDDLDFMDETAEQSTSVGPPLVIVPATEPETLVVEHDGDENRDTADFVPGVMAILPGDDDPTGLR